jgi:hypothetical protein
MSRPQNGTTTKATRWAGGLKYEYAVHLLGSLLVSMCRPLPCGVSDLSMYKGGDKDEQKDKKAYFFKVRGKNVCVTDRGSIKRACAHRPPQQSGSFARRSKTNESSTMMATRHHQRQPGSLLSAVACCHRRCCCRAAAAAVVNNSIKHHKKPSNTIKAIKSQIFCVNTSIKAIKLLCEIFGFGINYKK